MIENLTIYKVYLRKQKLLIRFISASKELLLEICIICFEDSKFDATISIHNQEHAYDPKKSLGEICRVTKKGGLIAIEVPVNRNFCNDLVDYKNLLNLITYFPENSLDVIWSETFYRNDKDKANLRVIFKRK